MMKKANRKKTIITMLVAVAAIGLMAGLFAMQHNDNVAGDSKAKATPAQSEPLTGDSPADSGTAASGKTEGDGGEGKSGGSAGPYARAEQMLKDYPDEKYEGFILQLKGDISAEDVEAVDRAIAGGAHLTKLPYMEGAYTAASLEDIRACVDESLIDCIEPDFQKHMMEGETNISLQSDDKPDDKLYESDQYNLRNMNVPAVWSYGLNGRDMDDTVDMDQNGNGTDDDIVVAIIDSGLKDGHLDIDQSRIVPGRNFYDKRTCGANFTDDTNKYGHGSKVAGIIAAISDNKRGIAGILQGVKIMPLRIFGFDGETSESIYLSALNYACEQKEEFVRTGGKTGTNICVINLSLGGTVASDLEKKACNRAIGDGILLVCAAGNYYDNSDVNKRQLPIYPAQYAMGVGSVDENNDVSKFSQRLSQKDGNGYANKLWVTAPGEAIPSIGNKETNSYGPSNGTSFSCPEVAALAALCKSLDNDMTEDEFKTLLKETAVSKDGTQGKINGQDVQYGWGLTDYRKTIGRLLENKTPEPGQTSVLTVKALNGAGSVIPSAQVEIREAIDGGQGTAEEPDEEGGMVWTLPMGKTYNYKITAAGYDTKEGQYTLITDKRTLKVILISEKPYPVTIRAVDVNGEETEYDSMTLQDIETGSWIRPTKDETYMLPNGKYECTVRAVDSLKTAETIVVDDVNEDLAEGKTVTIILRKDWTQLEVVKNGSAVFDEAVALVSLLDYATKCNMRVDIPGEGSRTVQVFGVKLNTMLGKFAPALDCIEQVTIRGKRIVQETEQPVPHDQSADDEGDDTEDNTEEDPKMEEAAVTLTRAELNSAVIALTKDPIDEDDAIITKGNWMRLAIDGRPVSDWLYSPELISVNTKDHLWNGGKVTRTATSAAPGVKTYTCTVCGATRTESIPMLAPAAVSGIQTAGNYDDRRIKVSFSSASGATDYIVRWRQNGGSWQSMRTGGGTYTWITRLSSGGMIDVQVQSYRSSDGKYGPWSDTARCLMSTVKTKKAKGGKKKVTVRWKKTSGATGYQVYYSTRKDMKGAKIKTVGKKKTSCTIKGLKKKTRYYVAVRPIRTSGSTYAGILSSVRSVKTKK